MVSTDVGMCMFRITYIIQQVFSLNFDKETDNISKVVQNKVTVTTDG